MIWDHRGTPFICLSVSGRLRLRRRGLDPLSPAVPCDGGAYGTRRRDLKGYNVSCMRFPRRPSIPVRIGSVTVGGPAPIVVQSMTNTDTADIESTVTQVKALARAGSELVGVTVNTDEAAAAGRHLRDRLAPQGDQAPIRGGL